MLCVGLIGAVVVNGVGCSRSDKRVNAGGASFIYPVMTKWVAEYKKAKNVSVNYTSSGSGAGIEQMIAKVYEFGCTDAPMTDKQLAKAKNAGGEVVHIPLALGAVVPTYNLDEVKKPIRFDGKVLAKIFLGKIKRWNDPELQALQEDDVTLPDKAIAVVHRSDGSGTTYIFTEFLAKHSKEWADGPGVDTSVNWGGVGEARKGNEGVAGYVSQTPGALGYNELIYALQNDIKYGLVKNKAGNYIKGSLKSVTAAADGAIAKLGDDFPEDLRFSLTDAPGEKSYPISGADWAVLYVNQPPEKGKLIVDFLNWVTHDGQQYCADLHYAPLPASLVQRLEKRLAQVKTGS
jgi:phosphate transport system substrate-binding protein